MKDIKLQILPLVGLIVLLLTLAFLQYRWLGQISEGEHERMKARLESDTRRFADEFNLELQNIYFNLQINAEDWQTNNFQEFNNRYNFWKAKTEYPNLIKDIYFVEFNENETLEKFSAENSNFAQIEWTESLNKVKSQILEANQPQLFAEDFSAILSKVSDVDKTFKRIILTSPNLERNGLPPNLIPKPYGVLIIQLDEDVIKNQILPNLKKKYFSTNEGSNFDISVIKPNQQVVYQTNNLTATDSQIDIFDLSPDKFIFYSNQQTTTSTNDKNQFIINQVETKTEEAKLPNTSNRKVEVRVMTQSKPRISADEINRQNTNTWILNVQHSSGSLDNFITQTRRKNLAISFGILSLLGISGILIFLSAQKAKLLAQRQIDFVSSVSHEFRTPLAVIYSAGENLADGVAKEQSQVSRYGNLIKGEGKKLSAMVEQILEFAGANSGKKKYDLREREASEIITDALSECQPLLAENGFTLEENIVENLPKIVADKNALSQAIQNLIVNAVKYSNGSKVVKFTALTEKNELKIRVKDYGIGIDKNDLSHIFEPFYRAKSVVDEQIHGNGLGLSLVKQTAEAHSGKIEVESEIGKGSEFILSLPISKKSDENSLN